MDCSERVRSFSLKLGFNGLLAADGDEAAVEEALLMAASGEEEEEAEATFLSEDTEEGSAEGLWL